MTDHKYINCNAFITVKLQKYIYWALKTLFDTQKVFASTGGTLVSPDTAFNGFCQSWVSESVKSCSGDPKSIISLQIQRVRFEKILLGSEFFFYETGTVITVRFSPEAQSGYCLLPEIMSRENSIFFALYRGYFLKTLQNLRISMHFLGESLKIDATPRKKIEFRCHTISGNKQRPD